MYQVLIMSDSHRLTKEIMEIRNRHKHIKHIIHCGDSELSIDAPELKDIIKVAGNCDFGEPFPEEKVINIGGLTFFVTHGHLHRVKENLLSLAYYVEGRDMNVVLYGHNHIANAQKIGKQLFINPGSIRYPRNRTDKTYAIMEWETLANINVNFYTVSGKHVPKLQFSTSFQH